MKVLITLSSLAIVLFSSCAFSQQSKTEGLSVKLGDSIAQMQSAYQTPIEAEPYESATNKGGFVLRLRTKGVWVFFNKYGKAYTIRLDPPFKGNVAGVKVGDTVLAMKKQLGEPVKKPTKFGLNDSYLYYPDDTYSASYATNEAGEVETIFLTK